MSVCFKHGRITYSGVRKTVDGKPGKLWTARDCGDVIGRVWLTNHTSRRSIVEILTAHEYLAWRAAEGKPYYVNIPGAR